MTQSTKRWMRFKEGAVRPANPALLSSLFAFCFAASVCSQTASPAQSNATEGPASTPSTVRGLIYLDAVVIDGSGKLVTGLEPHDFTLLDNGHPSTIVSLQAFNETAAKPNPPVEVILLVDTLELPFKLAMHEQDEVERFLRQNGGRLAHPVSIFGLSNTGLWTLAKSSTDGNALAERIAHNSSVPLERPALKGEPLNLLPSREPSALSALKALGQIATAERGKPGRKLLIWVGPGWGVGTGKPFFSTLDREQLFNAIDWFSTLLREARITLFTLSEGERLARDGTYKSALFYQEYLAGVKSEERASISNLDRRVLAVQSGGDVLDPHKDLATSFAFDGRADKMTMGTSAGRGTELAMQIVDFDLADEINRCVEEAGAFYTLSFNPAYTEVADEYHDLKVVVDKPGLTVRTKTEYYDQPYFYDRPNPAARRVSVAELRQVLEEGRGKRDADIAREISDLELTEQLSDAKVAGWQTDLSGARSRAALVALADASHFLDPPAADVAADDAPDLNAQQRMVALAVDYVNKTMRTLPNLFATRTTTRYEETPAHFDETGRHRISYEPLHQVGTAKETVLYRDGREIVQAADKRLKHNAGPEGLTDKGTFGPTLGAVVDAAAAPGGLTWSRWEKGTEGLRAVFRYAIAESSSRFQVSYCCLPYGDGTSTFHKLTGYHGEIAIDPESGAILRLTLISDLRSDLQLFRADPRVEYGPAEIGGMPLLRSDTLVEYGPVSIGGKTYICPVKSVSISRSRTTKILTGLPGEFRTFGPFATFLNDVSFGEYHAFRGEPRILPGFTQESNEK
jgi:VWFA-related protein